MLAYAPLIKQSPPLVKQTLPVRSRMYQDIYMSNILIEEGN